MPASNPITLAIPANSRATLSCTSNAYYTQLVTVALGGEVVTFVGSGEYNAPMLQDDGAESFIYDVPATGELIAAAFKNTSAEQWSTLSVPRYATSADGSTLTITVTAEDATDEDSNDACLTIAVTLPGAGSSSPSAPIAVPIPPGFTGGTITCMANASYYQRATVTITTEGGSEEVIFEGSGEAEPMVIPTTGETSYALTSAQASGRIEVKFEYRDPGLGVFVAPASVVPRSYQSSVDRKTLTIRTKSEDIGGGNADDNDCMLTIELTSD